VSADIAPDGIRDRDRPRAGISLGPAEGDEPSGLGGLAVVVPTSSALALALALAPK
jgi:hypothetical protein